MKLQILVFPALLVSVEAAATTYYATPNPTFDPDTGAEIATAAKTQAGDDVTAWSLTNCAARCFSGDRVILLKGVYDYSKLVRDTSVAGSLISIGNNKSTISFVGETGDRDDVTLVGGGTNLNLRLLYGSSKVRLESMTVKNFGIKGSGGVLATSIGRGTVVSNCTFFGNIAQQGGVLQDDWCGKYIDVFDCLFESNKFYYVTQTAGTDGGGAVRYTRCWRCTFIGNGHVTPEVKNQVRGGAAVQSELTDCVFIGNSAYIGAAVATGNTTQDSRRSICIRCAFTNNVVPSASAYGICSVAMTCTNCTFYGNRAPSGYVVGSSTERCQFVSNVCADVTDGGTHRNGLFVFNDCTTAGNNACGIINYSSADNCTIVSNIHPKHVIATTGLIRNCLLADNFTTAARTTKTPATYGQWSKGITNVVADVDYSGSSQTYNWVKDAKASSYVQWGADGLPCGTVRCGGSKKTVIDRGIDIGFTDADVDFAGKPRVFNGAVDIGCFEWPGPIPGLMMLVR